MFFRSKRLRIQQSNDCSWRILQASEISRPNEFENRCLRHESGQAIELTAKEFVDVHCESEERETEHDEGSRASDATKGRRPGAVVEGEADDCSKGHGSTSCAGCGHGDLIFPLGVDVQARGDVSAKPVARLGRGDADQSLVKLEPGDVIREQFHLAHSAKLGGKGGLARHTLSQESDCRIPAGNARRVERNSAREVSQERLGVFAQSLARARRMGTR
jgi:hypothetical protein